jgi:hypothetical protein
MIIMNTMIYFLNNIINKFEKNHIPFYLIYLKFNYIYFYYLIFVKKFTFLISFHQYKLIHNILNV